MKTERTAQECRNIDLVAERAKLDRADAFFEQTQAFVDVREGPEPDLDLTVSCHQRG